LLAMPFMFLCIASGATAQHWVTCMRDCINAMVLRTAMYITHYMLGWPAHRRLRQVLQSTVEHRNRVEKGSTSLDCRQGTHDVDLGQHISLSRHQNMSEHSGSVIQWRSNLTLHVHELRWHLKHLQQRARRGSVNSHRARGADMAERPLCHSSASLTPTPTRQRPGSHFMACPHRTARPGRAGHPNQLPPHQAAFDECGAAGPAAAVQHHSAAACCAARGSTSTVASVAPGGRPSPAIVRSTL
jgi:hypothetical protein